MNRRKDARKDMQLCAQVRDAVEMALMELEDDALQGAWVRAVEPNPDIKSLLVVIEAADMERASAALGGLRGRLRYEVSQAIHRKRTPEMSFRVVPPSPPEDAGSRG